MYDTVYLYISITQSIVRHCNVPTVKHIHFNFVPILYVTEISNLSREETVVVA